MATTNFFKHDPVPDYILNWAHNFKYDPAYIRNFNLSDVSFDVSLYKEEEKMSAENNVFNIGDLVRVIHGTIGPRYLKKTYKIIEMEIEPGMDDIMAKLQNVDHYYDIMTTSVKNIEHVPIYFMKEFIDNNFFENFERKFKAPKIKKIIFNEPATIIIWEDNTKTVVKCSVDEKYDPEKGMAMAVCKKIFGTNKSNSNYYNIFKEWLPEEKTVKDVLEPMTDNGSVPTFINKEDALDSIRTIAEGLSKLNKEANINVTDWVVK